MFDRSAFTDTIAQIRRDLDDIEEGVGWLHPVAYEKRTGGKGGTGIICTKCEGRGYHWQDGQRNDCNECVVAVIGDVGEIVLRRGTFADMLTQLNGDADNIKATVNGMTTRLARLAQLIDADANTDERWGPPTIDHREAAAAWAAKGRRVKRGEDHRPLRGVEKEAQEMLDRFRKQQEAVRQAAEKATKEREAKVRNRWTGAR